MRSSRESQNSPSTSTSAITTCGARASSHAGANPLMHASAAGDSTVDTQQATRQLPPSHQPDESSSATAATPTHVSSAATPAAASTISAAQGLARYFQGLAAGDEMTELIRGLRSSMWRCYQDCLQSPACVQAPRSSAAEGELPMDREAFADTSGELSSYSGGALLRGPSSRDAEAQLASPVHLISGKVAVPFVAVPETPAPIPPGKLKSAERRQYWVATKAAMLFAVESPSVAEEATALHCSTVARSILYNYYYPCEGGGDATSSPRASVMLESTPVMSTLQGGAVRWILSEARVVALARQELKVGRVDGGVCGWQRALALLHQVDPTPLTSAMELEVYRRTDGHHWAEALDCLWRIEPPQWTEMDVTAAVRCLYSAARCHSQEKSVSLPAEEATRAALDECKSDLSTSSSRFLAQLIAQALRIQRAVEEAGVLQWSTASALNDTLGLLAFSTARWQDACALLDKLLTGAATRALSRNADSSASATRRMQGAACNSRHVTEAAAITDGEPFLLRTHHDSESTSRRSDRSVGANSPERTTSAESLYHLVRANVVTVHQTCCALRTRWAVGLRYLQQLQETFADTLSITSDTAATEDVLRLCIAGQQWEAALRLVTAHEAQIVDGGEGGSRPSAMHHRSRVSDALKHPVASAVVAPKRATLPQRRQRYRPDVLVQLVRLLGSVPASRAAAYDLVRRHAASGAAPPIDATHVCKSSHTTVDLKLSKHYNRDTFSRAYNFLVQNAETLDAAKHAVEQLRHSQLPRPEGCNKGAREGKRFVGGDEGLQVSDMDDELAGLETESVAHIAYLSAVAGDWCRALHHANALLHEPRYRTTFFPTARLHDAVQYALEQAPSPGPSWQVSLQLFTDMMERNVPTSEVSFQCAVKRCFAGGVPGQAQKLFYYALRKGVRP
ncbi:hypothetical protein LSCM1_01888 [Leishmania martiniquensis]|uniref:Uncharacterized protein n=1 Tax=Leishmania martiniquensis TaxID=1580590 RepID=A0A836GMV8_9TRYP|nr:hypothetical protein LSCM1_01888 [Leishmania martiniquensis]